MADEDRRGFLKVATCAVGGGIAVVATVPVLRLIVAPARAITVTTPKDPIDVGPLDRIKVGAPWAKIPVIAPVVTDAWTTAKDVVLGAAWMRRTDDKTIEALSATCPHLGCAVGLDDNGFLCPCHNSRWDGNGKLVPGTGPAKRALDSLVVEAKDGRLRLTWVAYKLDTDKPEPM